MEMEVNSEHEDIITWRGSSNGNLSVKLPYEYYREKDVATHWEKGIWQTFIPPKISILIWRIIRGRVATAERLPRRGMHTGTVRLMCIQGIQEDENHIFIHCEQARNL